MLVYQRVGRIGTAGDFRWERIGTHVYLEFFCKCNTCGKIHSIWENLMQSDGCLDGEYQHFEPSIAAPLATMGIFTKHVGLKEPDRMVTLW